MKLYSKLKNAHSRVGVALYEKCRCATFLDKQRSSLSRILESNVGVALYATRNIYYKKIIGTMLVVGLIFVVPLNANATQVIQETHPTKTSQVIERYKEEPDDTEYESKFVVDNFIGMIANFSRERLDEVKAHYNEGFNDVYGCKIYFNKDGQIIQDIRSLYTFPKYAVAVNRSLNQVTVYGFDVVENAYNTPVVSFPCTCNKKKTSTGKFYTKEKYRWQKMLNGTWVQYATRITGNFLFHSTIYNSPNVADLDINIFNQLGEDESRSDGCVRLKVEDAYWLYKNLKDHALVVIYDNDVNREPLDKPLTFKITDKAMTFDPTDPVVTEKW